MLAITLFFVIVALGLKFQWGGQINRDRNTSASSDAGGVYDEKGNLLFSRSEGKGKSQPEMLNEMSDEELLTNDIRKQCRQLSVESGVPEDQLESTVEACVLLTMESEDDVQAEAGVDANSTPSPVSAGTEKAPAINNSAANLPKVDQQSFYQLTKKACEIVANEEKGLAQREKEKMIQACIDSNMKVKPQ